MSIEDAVLAHYRRAGLEAAIVAALAASGKDVARLAPVDLAGADEFHLGGHPATIALAQALAFPPGAHVLDIGSGIGGPARHFAEAYGVQVTGIDLTRDYVDAANGLSRRLGLDRRVTFRCASALSLPYPPASFDGAYSIHVGMNIDDKAAFLGEARQVLKQGGRFGIYDIMQVADGKLPFPMPWAESGETNFVEWPQAYRRLLVAAGFVIESETDRGELARTVAQKLRERAEKEGPPALGLHTVMGAGSRDRLANIMKALGAGLIAPIEFIARAA